MNDIQIKGSEDQAHVHLQDEREKNMCLEGWIENLEKQLKEANDIIKKYVETTPKVPNDGCHIPNYNLDNAECYLEKWGVK